MIHGLAAHPSIRALALTLLHFLWQGALLALLLFLTRRALGRATAQLRYVVACAALLAAIALPAVTFRIVLPDLAPPSPAAFTADTAPPLLALPADSIAEPAPAPLPWHAYVALATVATWLSLALVRLTRAGVGLYRIRALVRSSVPLRRSALRRALRVARRMGLYPGPRFLENDGIDVPMAIGFLRPVVLVPVSALTGLSPALLDALLAHELAHVRRHDFLVNVLCEVATSLLFFHPAAHYIAAVIRTEREQAADEEASREVAPETLARALFALESHRRPVPGLALGSHGGDLVNRIQRLLEHRSRPSSSPAVAPARTVSALVLASGVALFAGLGGVGACHQTQEPTAPAAGPVHVSEVQIPWLPPALSPYKPLFETAARKHHIDADALAIVTLVESAGDPEATSPAGAVGLMQIMPKTGALIAEQQGVPGFSESLLRDPAVNVDFGAFYLSEQASHLGAGADLTKQIALATAAYNAGPAAVKAHLEAGRPLPDETTRYQALVMGMFEERDLDRSPTFEAWRARARARAAERASTPVDGARVTATFGERDAVFGDRPHAGIDLAAAEGTPILAPMGGTVTATETDEKRGHAVVVRHPGGIETRYHHLASVTVRPGDRLSRGTQIGTLGNTGTSTGPHVHFEVRDLGTPIDPAPYLHAPR
ncbi:MAG: peptidoglycan DD-metalloendopeptidase family protein [Polyangiaceae bacterium]